VGEGYNVAVALEAGRGWEQLNFEQQGELLGRAYGARWFDGDGDASDSRRLLMRLTDPKSDDGFDVEVVPAAKAEELLAAGWRDATPLLREALAVVRAPR
jgi:hypothetical protein